MCFIYLSFLKLQNWRGNLINGNGWWNFQTSAIAPPPTIWCQRANMQSLVVCSESHKRVGKAPWKIAEDEELLPYVIGHEIEVNFIIKSVQVVAPLINFLAIPRPHLHRYGYLLIRTTSGADWLSVYTAPRNPYQHWYGSPYQFWSF